MFDQQQKEEERQIRQREAEALAAAEAKDTTTFDNIKEEIRQAIDKVKKQDEELKKYGSDKKVRQKAKDLSLTILDATIGEKYETAVKALEGKDKFKQRLKEGAELAEMLKEAVDVLTDHVNSANKANSAWGRIKKTLTELVSDDEG